MSLFKRVHISVLYHCATQGTRGTPSRSAHQGDGQRYFRGAMASATFNLFQQHTVGDPDLW